LTNLTNSGSGRNIEAMARVINLYEAKSQLSALVEAAASGEEIVIAKAGVPRARLVPVRRGRRRPGGSKGRIRIGQDFDAPLPDALLAAFAPKKR
jgi:prevent-host-death family protein